MEPASTEESRENAKISDSGYSNSCSNSQSHASGSSVSRNSKRSASSGYNEGNPSTIGSSSETLPKPITKRKDKSYKKKKSKNESCVTQVPTVETATTNNTSIGNVKPVQVASINNASVGPGPESSSPQTATEPNFSSKSSLVLHDRKTTEEVAVVELVDATDPGVHNDNNSLTCAAKAAELDSSKANAIDGITAFSQPCSEEYYAVISMLDGLVLYATSSLHASLGYPRDSWTGKLFTDFLDAKDKDIVANKIANEIAVSRDYRSTDVGCRKEITFCRLRKYSASLVCDTPSQQQQSPDECMPYRINFLFQNFQGDKSSSFQNQVMLLAFFKPIHSAYKAPEETILSTVFTTRHTVNCRLSYVDPDVVQYLGYLPQDMIDRSLFDFYYPEDLPLIKDIYETVVNLENTSYRSKPYRFVAQNGDIVVLETKWSTFVNPWKKNLEFIVGQHRVLRGPADPDVFRSPAARESHSFANISEEVLKEAKIIQEEIMALLNRGIERRSSCAVADCDLLAKKNELASFVENVLLEIKSLAPGKDHMAVDERSFWEHDSVMLGEISPHHEYLDSKSSTETPPSYNQLNYLDNIKRFFSSNLDISVNKKPYGSDEENVHSSANSSDELQASTKNDGNSMSAGEPKGSSSTNGSGNSGSELNNRQSFDSRGETSNATSRSTNLEPAPVRNTAPTVAGQFKLPILTESLLNRHNEDMEKLMMQLHREKKKNDKRSKSSINEQKAKQQQQPQPQLLAAAVAKGEVAPRNKSTNQLKRVACQNWEAQNGRGYKQPRHEGPLQPVQQQVAVGSNDKGQAPRADLWQTMTSTAMPVAATSVAQHRYPANNAFTQAMDRYPTFPQMVPVCYVPAPMPWENPFLISLPKEHPGPPKPISQPAPYCFLPMPYVTTPLQSVMYPPMMGVPPMCNPFVANETTPTAAFSGTLVNPMAQQIQPALSLPTAMPAPMPTPFDLKRPSSRETSVKAEPGSTMAMSDSSKKMVFPCGVVSHSSEGGCFSVTDECTTANTTKDHSILPEDKAGCSKHSSSLFSSSLNISYCSDSNTYQQNTASSVESKESQPKQAQSRKEFRVMRKEPPWMEGIKMTPELMYEYQLTPKSLEEVLKTDLDFLNRSKQPSMVNDQLKQLLLDLDVEGFTSKLILEETGASDSSNSSDLSQRSEATNEQNTQSGAQISGSC